MRKHHSMENISSVNPNLSNGEATVVWGLNRVGWNCSEWRMLGTVSDNTRHEKCKASFA